MKKVGGYLTFLAYNKALTNGCEETCFVLRGKTVQVSCDPSRELYDASIVAERKIEKDLKYDSETDTMIMRDPERLLASIDEWLK